MMWLEIFQTVGICVGGLSLLVIAFTFVMITLSFVPVSYPYDPDDWFEVKEDEEVIEEKPTRRRNRKKNRS